MVGSILAVDASTARTLNIREHVEKAGGPTKFASIYGSNRWSQAQVSQWIADNPKRIGGRLARDLEAVLGMTHGSLDRRDNSEQSAGGQRLIKVRDKDLISIPQYAVAGAMGHGQVPPDHAEIVQSMVARVSDLRKRCSFSSPHNLQLITGIGPSMQPTFSDGDVLLIDTGVKTVDVDAIYVFTLGNGRAGNLFIKTLQRRRDGSLLMVSHNRQGFEPEVIPQDEGIEIHGRVILVWNARPL